VPQNFWTSPINLSNVYYKCWIHRALNDISRYGILQLKTPLQLVRGKWSLVGACWGRAEGVDYPQVQLVVQANHENRSITGEHQHPADPESDRNKSLSQHRTAPSRDSWYASSPKWVTRHHTRLVFKEQQVLSWWLSLTVCSEAKFRDKSKVKNTLHNIWTITRENIDRQK
jgi:hypothetical protein